jgi:tRNA-splicing ligase RtcB
VQVRVRRAVLGLRFGAAHRHLYAMPSFEVLETGRVPVKAWTRGVAVEEPARQQLRNLSNLPFAFSHVGFAVHKPGDWNRQVAGPLLGDLAPWLAEKHPTLTAKRKASLESIVLSQFGTLGGGNHFIELCIDQARDLWLMLHSGSRGIGNAIGQYFIERAREEMARRDVHLPDRDLAYLVEGESGFDDYVRAVGWAQNYAAANRAEMLRRVMIVLHRHLPAFREREEAVNCHHNYVARERHFGEDVWVTRKGAVRAGAGELGIIPGSMGARSYIVRGKGNAESFQSCSHGAGRAMSRGEAKRRFTLAEHEAATAGIECRKDAG